MLSQTEFPVLPRGAGALRGDSESSHIHKDRNALTPIPEDRNAPTHKPAFGPFSYDTLEKVIDLCNLLLGVLTSIQADNDYKISEPDEQMIFRRMKMRASTKELRDIINPAIALLGLGITEDSFNKTQISEYQRITQEMAAVIATARPSEAGTAEASADVSDSNALTKLIEILAESKRKVGEVSPSSVADPINQFMTIFATGSTDEIEKVIAALKLHQRSQVAPAAQRPPATPKLHQRPPATRADPDDENDRVLNLDQVCDAKPEQPPRTQPLTQPPRAQPPRQPPRAQPPRQPPRTQNPVAISSSRTAQLVGVDGFTMHLTPEVLKMFPGRVVPNSDPAREEALKVLLEKLTSLMEKNIWVVKNADNRDIWLSKQLKAVIRVLFNWVHKKPVPFDMKNEQGEILISYFGEEPLRRFVLQAAQVVQVGITWIGPNRDECLDANTDPGVKRRESAPIVNPLIVAFIMKSVQFDDKLPIGIVNITRGSTYTDTVPTEENYFGISHSSIPNAAIPSGWRTLRHMVAMPDSGEEKDSQDTNCRVLFCPPLAKSEQVKIGKHTVENLTKCPWAVLLPPCNCKNEKCPSHEHLAMHGVPFRTDLKAVEKYLTDVDPDALTLDELRNGIAKSMFTRPMTLDEFVEAAYDTVFPPHSTIVSMTDPVVDDGMLHLTVLSTP